MAAALYRDGQSLLLLARSQASKSARERIRQALAWHGIELDGRIETVDGDIGKPNLGLDRAEFSRIASSATELVHCASSTSFAMERKVQTEATNIEGTRHCLELAAQGKIQHFTYISTAYVSGRGYAVCPEQLLDRGHEFFNPYESSKLEGELMTAELCTKAGIGYTIFRPSIIIGSAVDGRSLLFNAMYYVVRFFDTMQQMIRRDLQNGDGRNAAVLGARLLPDNALLFPMRVDLRKWPDAKLNVVPIDYVVACFMAAYRAVAESTQVYNLVHSNPTSAAELLRYSGRYFNLIGIAPTYTDGTRLGNFNDLERNFHNFADIYLPYMADPRTFAHAKISALAAAEGVECPDVDFQVFTHCIDYARQHRWQSPLKGKGAARTASSAAVATQP